MLFGFGSGGAGEDTAGADGAGGAAGAAGSESHGTGILGNTVGSTLWTGFTAHQ